MLEGNDGIKELCDCVYVGGNYYVQLFRIVGRLSYVFNSMGIFVSVAECCGALYC